MSMGNWPFADLTWWVNAIHRSCGKHACVAPSIFDWDHYTKGIDGFNLDQLGSWYEETLGLLKTGRLPVDGVPSLLFRAKALKKWKMADPALANDRQQEALRGFLERNVAARQAGLVPWPYSVLMAEILDAWLPEPERLGWSWTGKFGPGAVAEHLSHARRYEHLARWCELGDHWPDVPPTGDITDHDTARLCAVPKDYHKDRLITIEPTYGSFVQAYAREAMQCSIHCGPLKGTAMDLHWTDGQEMQRRLALKASRTKTLATLDLKDASDGITFDQVAQVFPSWVVHLLEVTRSSKIRLDADVGHWSAGEYPLWIYAGMGNGTTFTVETLFFAAFVKAYARAQGLPSLVSTFGDDIICHSRTAQALIASEGFPFFRINRTKSFLGSDALRESCGIFAYNGVDITVPKVDGYLRNHEGIVALADLHRRLINNPQAYAQRLSYLIAQDGSLVNWDRSYWGYPSIDDPRVERSLAPQTRWNRKLMRREALLPTATQRTVAYTTDWMAAKKYNHPSPHVWLPAVLSGQIGSMGSPSLRIEGRGPHRRRFSVKLPLPGSRSWGVKWLPEVGATLPNSAKCAT